MRRSPPSARWLRWQIRGAVNHTRDPPKFFKHAAEPRVCVAPCYDAHVREIRSGLSLQKRIETVRTTVRRERTSPRNSYVDTYTYVRALACDLVFSCELPLSSTTRGFRRVSSFLLSRVGQPCRDIGNESDRTRRMVRQVCCLPIDIIRAVFEHGGDSGI